MKPPRLRRLRCHPPNFANRCLSKIELFAIRGRVNFSSDWDESVFQSEMHAEVMLRQSECANPRIRLTVLYRETETGKRLMGRTQAICILADVPITDLR
jgi:hypothetical protein